MIRNRDFRMSGKMVLVLFVLTNTVYAVMLSYSIPKLVELSGGLPLFDMSPLGYSCQQAIALLSALGQEGRDLYLSLQLPLDILYPMLFAFCYVFLMKWLISIGNLSNRCWNYVSVTPILVCVFDYAENICIWLMLTKYPEVSKGLVITSSVYTQMKSTLTMIYFVGLLLAISVVAITKLHRKLKVQKQ